MITNASDNRRALRLVFAGTPGFAVHHLRALLNSHHEIVAVYTQPDRPAGRGHKLRAGPVKTAALEAGLPVFQPASFKEDNATAKLAALRPDVLAVVAYGLILPESILALPHYGCLNVHASLLPRWRGAAPIERAIEAGDAETGITIMQMDAGLDTGDMLARTACPIGTDDTGDRIREHLAGIGAPLLLDVLDRIAATGARLEGTPQDHAQATGAPKLQRDEAAVDWSASATEVDRRIRAYCSANVATARYDGQSVRLWGCRMARDDARSAEPGMIIALEKDAIVVACATGALALTRLQLPGGKVLASRDILNGRRGWFKPGRRFC